MHLSSLTPLSRARRARQVDVRFWASEAWLGLALELRAWRWWLGLFKNCLHQGC